jgi:uncharacterized protein (UPF0276 family)
MLKGIGLGFRRDLAEDILTLDAPLPEFVELAPENWMGIGGYWRKQLHRVAEKYPISAHGLSLSIGSPDKLDIVFIQKIKSFLDEFNIGLYSEHLSYSKCDNAHLYDLLPIPFREDAVKHIVQRIQQVQDILERQLVLENVSYYTPVAAEMNEEEFISTIVRDSGCGLLLDINNVYVNSFNHNYDAKQFLHAMPLDQVKYIHMAGHTKVSDDLIIDTHANQVIPPVFELFEYATSLIEPVPVLLERDFNFPEFNELKTEMDVLKQITSKSWKTASYAQN